jgi:hypothetical protein
MGKRVTHGSPFIMNIFFAMTNLPPQLVALSRENKEHSLSEGGDSRSHPKQRNKKLEDDFVEFVF